MKKYDSPRNLDETNPQIDELGVQKETDSQKIQDSFQVGYGGEWQPILAKVKRALLDNMEVPGAPYMGRNRNQDNGSPWNGMGEPVPMRQNENRDWSMQWKKLNIDNMPVIDENFEVLTEDKNLKKEEPIMSAETKKKVNFKKISAKREERIRAIYEIDEDWAAYGRYCAKCVGTWKELLGYDERKKLGIERESEVWRCPKCGEITTAKGSVSEQTSGFSAYNTFTKGPVTDDEAFAPMNKIKEDKERTKR